MSYTENALPHIQGNGVTLVPSVIPVTPAGSDAAAVPSPVPVLDDKKQNEFEHNEEVKDKSRHAASTHLARQDAKKFVPVKTVSVFQKISKTDKFMNSLIHPKHHLIPVNKKNRVN